MEKRPIGFGLVMISLWLGLVAPIAWAEIIYLKNGKKVQGKIVEHNEKLTKINISGITLTYYANEIDRIDTSVPVGESPVAIETPPTVTPQAVPKVSKPPESPTPRIAQPAEPIISSPSRAPALRAGQPNPPVNPTVFAAPLPQGEKKQLILQLIDAMGTKLAMQTTFEQIIKEAPAQDAEQLKKALNLDDVISRLVPVYDKYFSEEEIKVLLSFYQSPVGRKLIKVTPLLMDESMKANMNYFQEVFPKPEAETPK